MFTKKRIIIAVISAVLVAALAVGAVFIAGGSTAKPIVKEEYVKKGMPDITFKFNGENIVFSYDHTENVPMGKERNLDGKEVYITTDHYVSENGYEAKKFPDADKFISIKLTNVDLYKNEKELSQSIAEAQIKRIVRDAVNSSDFAINLDEKTTSELRIDTETVTYFKDDGSELVFIKGYSARVATDDYSLTVSLDSSGKPYFATTTFNSNPSEKSKKAAQAKFDNWLTEKRSEGGKYVVEDVCYESRGNKNYAFFMFTYYPYAQSDNPTPETDAHSVYTVFCEL